jgi:hypothetical protein
VCVWRAKGHASDAAHRISQAPSLSGTWDEVRSGCEWARTPTSIGSHCRRTHHARSPEVNQNLRHRLVSIEPRCARGHQGFGYLVEYRPCDGAHEVDLYLMGVSLQRPRAARGVYILLREKSASKWEVRARRSQERRLWGAHLRVEIVAGGLE